MSDNQNFGFGKFVPGFDFLQNLAKGASQTLPQMPNLSNWVAPTLNLEELEKRIGELKAVHFWLDQNSKALSATIQALEVQKMTLATLKGMNVSMGEVADALKLKAADAMAGASKTVGVNIADAAPAQSAVAPPPAGKKKAAGKSTSKSAPAAASGVIDPLQWWGALTQQFQEIAAGAMKEAANPLTSAPGTNKDTGGRGAASKSTAKRAAKKPAR
jgi:hypothetical protein